MVDLFIQLKREIDKDPNAFLKTKRGTETWLDGVNAISHTSIEEFAILMNDVWLPFDGKHSVKEFFAYFDSLLRRTNEYSLESLISFGICFVYDKCLLNSVKSTKLVRLHFTCNKI